MNIKYILIPIFLLFFVSTSAQRKNVLKQSISYDESLYNSIKYRLVGPFRGGRAGTVTGVNNNRNLYYMGTAGGVFGKPKMLEIHGSQLVMGILEVVLVQ